jgi:hypothetical protein
LADRLAGRGRLGHLASARRGEHRRSVPDSEPVIYREEVTAILGVLADILVEVRDIAAQLRGDDEEEEE